MSDFGALNSATKYPSIETYHALDPKDGTLLDKAMPFTGNVVLTEKIDGTNGRIVVMPDGDWFIGSREELLYARGDRIENPALGIVPVLLPLAEKIGARPRQFSASQGATWVFYLEVYGKQAQSGARQYTGTGKTGCRLFDVAAVNQEVLAWERPQIASWRDHGGQQFLGETVLADAAAGEGVELTPRLGVVDASELPAGIAEMQDFIRRYLPQTKAPLDEGAGGTPEGIVLRAEDRTVIAKAKSKDYERTFRVWQGRR